MQHKLSINLLSPTPLLSSYVRRFSELLVRLFTVDDAVVGTDGETTATDAATTAAGPVVVTGDVVLVPTMVDTVFGVKGGGGELLLTLPTSETTPIVLVALDGTTAAIGKIFSTSGLLGIRSYMRLPSAALGGFGKNSTFGLGMFSLAVRRSHSLTNGPGLPKRSAMCVTLPRFFFLYTRKWATFASTLPVIAVATTQNTFQ